MTDDRQTDGQGQQMANSLKCDIFEQAWTPENVLNFLNSVAFSGKLRRQRIYVCFLKQDFKRTPVRLRYVRMALAPKTNVLP